MCERAFIRAILAPMSHSCDVLSVPYYLLTAPPHASVLGSPHALAVASSLYLPPSPSSPRSLSATLMLRCDVCCNREDTYPPRAPHSLPTIISGNSARVILIIMSPRCRCRLGPYPTRPTRTSPGSPYPRNSDGRSPVGNTTGGITRWALSARIALHESRRSRSHYTRSLPTGSILEPHKPPPSPHLPHPLPAPAFALPLSLSRLSLSRLSLSRSRSSSKILPLLVTHPDGLATHPEPPC